MSKLTKADISRINGAKSKGPKTPEGKARSSQNAVRHGLAAQTVVLANESPDRFEQMLADYVARFQPADRVELDLIEELVGAKWRLRRIIAVDCALLDYQVRMDKPALDQRFSSVDPETRTALSLEKLSSSSIRNLHRYEANARRTAREAFNQLMLLQSLRRQLESEAQDAEAEKSRERTRKLAHPVPVPSQKKCTNEPTPVRSSRPSRK